MKRRSEGNQGERNWDIEKWTKITLFQGENSVFVNRQTKKKKKKWFRANCPKTHVQGCVDPSWRKKRRKEQNTKRREGIFKRSLFKFTKTQSTKEHRKTPEKASAPQPQADFWQRPESNPNRDGGVKTKTRQKLHKLGPARAKWEKRHFQNLLGSAAPGLFWPSKTNLVKNSNFRKKQIRETPKNLRQKWTATWRRYNGSNANQPGPTTQNCSETPCFEAFRVPLPLGLRLEEPRPETQAKNENLFGPQKTTSTTSKMAFLKNPKNPKTVRKLGFRTPQKKPFRAVKQWFQKGGAAN